MKKWLRNWLGIKSDDQIVIYPWQIRGMISGGQIAGATITGDKIAARTLRDYHLVNNMGVVEYKK
jgi:hypothetical protein